jgi:hypothetical protein
MRFSNCHIADGHYIHIFKLVFYKNKAPLSVCPIGHTLGWKVHLLQKVLTQFSRFLEFCSSVMRALFLQIIIVEFRCGYLFLRVRKVCPIGHNFSEHEAQESKFYCTCPQNLAISPAIRFSCTKRQTEVLLAITFDKKPNNLEFPSHVPQWKVCPEDS